MRDRECVLVLGGVKERELREVVDDHYEVAVAFVVRGRKREGVDTYG